MDFKTYRISDGFFSGRGHRLDISDELAPGVLVVWYPESDGVRPRVGIVAGVNSGQVHVMWNPWENDPNELSYRRRGEGGRCLRVG